MCVHDSCVGEIPMKLLGIACAGQTRPVAAVLARCSKIERIHEQVFARRARRSGRSAHGRHPAPRSFRPSRRRARVSTRLGRSRDDHSRREGLRRRPRSASRAGNDGQARHRISAQCADLHVGLNTIRHPPLARFESFGGRGIPRSAFVTHAAKAGASSCPLSYVWCSTQRVSGLFSAPPPPRFGGHAITKRVT